MGHKEPSSCFITYCKNTSRITTDVKSIKRSLKFGRCTQTLQKINDWLETFGTKTVALEILQQQSTKHTSDAIT